MKEEFTEINIDLLKTRFSCFDGTNTMSRAKTVLQHRFQGKASYSIYVNCRCHSLALCFSYLIKEKIPWMQKIDQMLLRIWKMHHYSSKSRHVLAELQKAYGVKTPQMVIAVPTRWLSHGTTCNRFREKYSIISHFLDNAFSKNQNAKSDSVQILIAGR